MEYDDARRLAERNTHSWGYYLDLIQAARNPREMSKVNPKMALNSILDNYVELIGDHRDVVPKGLEYCRLTDTYSTTGDLWIMINVLRDCLE